MADEKELLWKSNAAQAVSAVIRKAGHNKYQQATRRPNSGPVSSSITASGYEMTHIKSSRKIWISYHIAEGDNTSKADALAAIEQALRNSKYEVEVTNDGDTVIVKY